MPLISQKYLFLDRDGVINERLPGDYVKAWEEFRFTGRALDALAFLTKVFDRIVVVTNQQGIGKGLMAERDLAEIHRRMLKEIRNHGGHIDGIYHCPDLKSREPNCRKPGPAMALAAQRDFPEITFEDSLMVGDSASDLEFGRRLGMQLVLIEGKEEDQQACRAYETLGRYDSLWAFAAALKAHLLS